MSGEQKVQWCTPYSSRWYPPKWSWPHSTAATHLVRVGVGVGVGVRVGVGVKV